MIMPHFNLVKLLFEKLENSVFDDKLFSLWDAVYNLRKKESIFMAFDKEFLSQGELEELRNLSRNIRGDILKMTTLAKSGHPGGSMSSCDIYLTVWKFANVKPEDPNWDLRDRIVVSHGHTSPAVYATLGRLGFFDIHDAISYFRLSGSPFEGHIEREIPGVEWTTGNLGQGLAAGVGFALASKVLNKNYHVFVLMSDAEQAKGQVAEARRMAKKYGLSNITVVIDYNNKQISGSVSDVMPINIRENYESDGWKVIEVDGHDFQQIYSALRKAVLQHESPVCILAHTVMGKGVSFMENREVYHGKPLNIEEYKKAIDELGVEDNLDFYIEKRKTRKFPVFKKPLEYEISIKEGEIKYYEAGEKVATRVALGDQLLSVAKRNLNSQSEYSLFAVFDCDLAESLRFVDFKKNFPNYFFEMGVQEHATATVSGALSIQGVIAIFGDFGVFGVDETYNQHRLNDINHTNLKLVISHIGIDVGEDGKTHHCIDYIGVLRNLYGFKLVVPADGNQTKSIFNYVMARYGNYAIAVGRSSWPIVTDEFGKPYFNEKYVYEYGKADVLRAGESGAIVAYGATVGKALELREILKDQGFNFKVINVSSPFRIDEEVFLSEDIKKKPIFVYEDHNVNTGLGVILSDFYVSRGVDVKLYKFGIKNYSTSGAAEELYDYNNLSPSKVAQQILEIMNKL